MTTSRVLVVLMLALGLAACGGGGAEVTSTVSGATLGQELQDLEQARQQGLITEEEYEDKREAIMDRYEQ
jgi:ABC-type glycerol-3-phosphate transport system substrate-binding protein